MELKEKVEQWFIDRGLDQAEPAKQVLKLMEEAGELFEGIAKNDEALIKDAIGDIQVVLIGLAMQIGAWDERKSLEDEDSAIIKLIPLVVSYAVYLMKPSDDARFALMLSNASIPIVLDEIANLYNSNAEECLEIAYNEIKDRKGKLVNGVFVKEEDLHE